MTVPAMPRCDVCRGLIDPEDLFCATCGREAPSLAVDSQRPLRQASTHNFECQACGASMSYDASARTLRCPFCGSERLDAQADGQVLAPSLVVPLVIPQPQAIAALRQWLGSGFWRPGDLATAAVVTKMVPLYVPYWVFQAATFTYWTADSGHVPAGARGSWVPVAGEHRGDYAGLLIGASGTLTPNETLALCPFDLSRGVSPSQVDLENAIYEPFRVQRKYARPLVFQQLEGLEREACSRHVSGAARNLRVNVRIENLSGQPVLLPIWIMAYTYRGRIFRFLMNGQTGRATGTAPLSWTKVIVLISLIAILLIVVALFTLLAGRR